MNKFMLRVPSNRWKGFFIFIYGFLYGALGGIVAMMFLTFFKVGTIFNLSNIIIVFKGNYFVFVTSIAFGIVINFFSWKIISKK